MRYSELMRDAQTLYPSIPDRQAIIRNITAPPTWRDESKNRRAVLTQELAINRLQVFQTHQMYSLERGIDLIHRDILHVVPQFI